MTLKLTDYTYYLKFKKLKSKSRHALPRHAYSWTASNQISSVNCHTAKISEFVDHNLQPIVQNLKSYVKDTSDFVRKIKNIGKVPDDSYLVSMDVRALYTNISHEMGIKYVNEPL